MTDEDKNNLMAWMSFISNNEGTEIGDAIGTLLAALDNAYYLGDEYSDALEELALKEVKNIITSDWWKEDLKYNNLAEKVKKLEKEHPLK